VIAEAQTNPIEFSGSLLVEQHIPLDHPRLWFPNGYGDQPLYRLRATLVAESGEVVDEKWVSFGIRQIKTVANEGAPPDALPYTLEVNGRKVFMKGWNWTPMDHLYGSIPPERYERILLLAKEANVNLLRVWGGGLIEKEIFYNLCDRLGIMVWQEFIQSSSGIDNEPPTAPDYLRMAEEHARGIIPRRRNHPSLAIWCGGNELMREDWVPLTLEHPTIALLQSCVRELDPDRIFLPTSASGPCEGADPQKAGQMHDVHGPWVYLGATEHYRFYNAIDPLLHSEFGAEGAANLETLRQIASEDHLWPPDGTNELWVYHGSWWINRAKVEALFGPIEDIETFVRLSQYLQAEGLRYAVESNRRRKWRCSGTSPWQMNESWPNTSGTFCVDYYLRPKPAYWWIQRAYAPVLVSARYEKIGFQPGETFAATLWLNHSRAESPSLTISWTLQDLEGRVFVSDQSAINAPPDGVMQAGAVSWTIPQGFAKPFVLTVKASDTSGATLSRNACLFSAAPEPILSPLRTLPPTALRIEAPQQVRLAGEEAEFTASVENTGSVAALGLIMQCDLPDLYITGNYEILMPGESHLLRIKARPGEARTGRFRVSAWNVPPHSFEIRFQ